MGKRTSIVTKDLIIIHICTVIATTFVASGGFHFFVAIAVVKVHNFIITEKDA